MSSISKELAELLVDNGLLSDADLEQVEQEKDKTGEPLRIILERLNLATEKQLKNTLELQYGVNYLALHTVNPELPVVDLLPADIIHDHRVVPIHIDGNRLTVAMVNPDDSSAMAAIKANVKFDVKPLVCFEDDFQIFLDQIEKMRHMPDRQVAPVDDSEFGPEVGPVESGAADDTTGEIIEELSSEEFALSEEADAPQNSEHEAADATDFQQAEEEFAAQTSGNDEVTSDTVSASPSLVSGTYSAQYDTGSLDAISTPNIPSTDLANDLSPAFDASQLDSIPTPSFDANALDSIPTPKAEANEPIEKPQPGGISSFFKGGGGAPRKAASDPSQERSGGLSALRGMMGGKKGGKKNEPVPRPAPPPPPPPPPSPSPQAPAASETTASQPDTAGGAEEPQAKSGLLSSKLGSAAHHLSGAKKFLKEKRTDSQPITPQETKEEPIPEWMNQIDENTPIAADAGPEQINEDVQEQDLSMTEEQAVNEYYAELGFDPTAEEPSPEISSGEEAEGFVAAEVETEATEETKSETGANYEVPPMDPSGANFMSWTENSATEELAVSEAIAEASEALAASNAAVEEALADAEEAWQEASAAADEAVAAGDISSDELPAFVQGETQEPVQETGETQAAPAEETEQEWAAEEPAPEGSSVEATVQETAVESLRTEDEAPSEISEAAEEVAHDTTDETAQEELASSVSQEPTQEVTAPEIAEEEVVSEVIESAPAEGSSEATAALLDEMATLADTLADEVPAAAENVTDMPDDSEFAETQEWAETIEASAAAAAEVVAEEPSEISTAATAEESSPAAEVPQTIAASVDELNLDDSEFLSGVEEIQAMAELSFNEQDTGKKEVDEFAEITDWGDEAPAVENLMSNLSSAAGEEKIAEETSEGLEAPPFPQEDLLQEMGVINADQVPAIRKECLTTGQSLSVVLERMGIAGEMELSDAFDMQFGAGYVSLASMTIESEILNLLPAKTVEQRKVLPVGKTGNKVIIAMVNPDDLAAMNDIKFRLKGLEIKKAVCLEDDFEHFLRTHLVQSNGEPHFEGTTPKSPEVSAPSNGAAPPESNTEAPPAVQEGIELIPVVEETSAPVVEDSGAVPAATTSPAAPEPALAPAPAPVAVSEPEPAAPPPPPPPPPAPAPAAAPAPAPVAPVTPPASPDQTTPAAPVAPVVVPPAAPAPIPASVTPPPVINPAAIPSAPKPVAPPPPPAPQQTPALPPGIAALAKPPQPAAQVSAPPVINPAAVPQSPGVTPGITPGAPAVPARPLLQPTLHEIPAQKPPSAPAAQPPVPPAAATPAPPVLPTGVVPPKPISPQQIPNLAGQPRVNVPPATTPPVQSPVSHTTPVPPAPAAPTQAAPGAAAPPAPAPALAPQLPPVQTPGQTPRVQPAGLAAPPTPAAPAPAVPQAPAPAVPQAPAPAPAPAPLPATQQAPVAVPVPAPAPAAPQAPVSVPVPTPTPPAPPTMATPAVTPPVVPPAAPVPPAVPVAPQPVAPVPAPPVPPSTPVQPAVQPTAPIPAAPVPAPQTAAPPVAPPPPSPQPPVPPAAIAPAASPLGTTPSIPPASAPATAMPMPRINPNQIPGVRAQQQSSGSNPVVPPPQPVATPISAPVPAPAAPVAPAPAAPAVPAPPAAPPGPPPLDPNLLSLARDIINKAADNGFSDVHIEPQAAELELRYWYDGALIESTKLEKHIHAELLRCYKSIAGLSPEETNKPQDKRLKWTDTGAELDIRITTIPSEHGEMVAVSIKFDDEE